MRRKRNAGATPPGSRYYGSYPTREGSDSDVFDEIGTELRYYIMDTRADAQESMAKRDEIIQAWEAHDYDRLYDLRLISYDRMESGDLTRSDGERIKDAIDELGSYAIGQLDRAVELEDMWRKRDWVNLYAAGALSEDDYNFLIAVQQPADEKVQSAVLKRRLL